MKDINKIIRIVEKHAGFSIRNKGRKRELVEYRQIAQELALNYTNCSLKQIGYATNQDHSTVIYARKQVEILMCNKEFERRYKEIEKIVIKELNTNAGKRTQMIHDLEQRIYGAEHPEHLAQMKSRLGHLLYDELQD